MSAEPPSSPPSSLELVASGYDAFYAAWGTSATMRAIWRDHVTGADFPEEFAHISFLPLAALKALTEGLRLREGDLFADLACGAGGPGLAVAQATGATLVGVDLSPVAVEKATARVLPLGLGGRAAFRQGTFAETGLPTGSVAAAMTVDALQYAPDKAAALAEVARIVRPGGRFAFVAFELDAARIAGLPVWQDPVADYRPLLAEAGFDVLGYEQTPGWREQVAAGFGAVLDQQAVLTEELGEAAAGAVAMEASITLELQPYCGHVLAVTERR